MKELPDLENAYALDSPEATKDLYQSWAPGYDAGFVETQGYQLAREVAQGFAQAGGRGPVLDVGAGTGAVAEGLARAAIEPVDGADLSPDMLQIARKKGLYRDCFTVDVTRIDTLPGAPYQGIVSAGTFTHGHLGPEALLPLLEHGASGTLCVISVNAAHYKSHGFEAELLRLNHRITGLRFKDVRIYSDKADPEHRLDMARLVIFRML